ncbi:MAG TPA: DEAD/DEAH box helicase, partial [Steroidobacteraceae bacterium]|nr:DEAD/DEAH box helicase [Steroidobacteraceae bacterium]
MSIARVALDVPIDEAFDFRIPVGFDAPRGALVVVPFGRTRKVGVVVGHEASSRVPASRLRDLESLVGDVAPFKGDELELFEFCAAYYQRPLGEVIAASLPPRLRQVRRRTLRPSDPATGPAGFEATVALNAEQQGALDAVRAAAGFQALLLQGVTGSGKTEVYLHLIADALARGRQALMLVPEIGLTPQFEARVRARFPGARLAAAHSGLSLGERAQAWIDAQSGAAQLVLGTRSAVFMP